MRRYLFAILLMLAATAAQASIISGDFRTEANLPDYRSGQALVYQHAGSQVGAGAELTSHDLARNPDRWRGGQVDVDLNPVNALLSLKSNDQYDFQSFDVYLNNLSFDSPGSIYGIALISSGLLTVPLAPTVSFTDTSIHISYNAGHGVFNFTQGEALFQLLLGNPAPQSAPEMAGEGADGESNFPAAGPAAPAAVPEPSTLLLVGLGLAGLGAFGRKFRKS